MTVCPNCGGRVYVYTDYETDGKFTVTSTQDHCHKCGYTRFRTRKKALTIESRIGYDFSNYYRERAKLPQPDGEHCIICGKDLPSRKRKYCSDECYSEWSRKIQTENWGVLRNKTLEASNLKCIKCGFQVEYNAVSSEEYPFGYCTILSPEDQKGKRISDNPSGLFVVDHIKPIALGGKEFDSTNLQVLCSECNKEKTKIDLKTIAKKRSESTQFLNPLATSLKTLDYSFSSLDVYFEKRLLVGEEQC